MVTEDSRRIHRSRGSLGIVGMDGMATGVEPSSAEPAVVHAGGPTARPAAGEWLTASEISTTLKVDRSTVYRWARARAIPSIKICGTRRFDAAAVGALTQQGAS